MISYNENDKQVSRVQIHDKQHISEWSIHAILQCILDLQTKEYA